MVKKSAELFGSQSIVASIDAKKVDGVYKCVIADGTDIINRSPIELAEEAEKLGAGEIILNSVDNDGMMQGYDLDLVRNVVDTVKIPVIALGGAGGIDDLKKVIVEGHAHAAAGGSMFVYYGRLKAVLITFPDESELKKAKIYG